MKSSMTSLNATLPRPKFSKGAKQRLNIVEATIERLAEAGLDGTTFESIAQRCNLKRPHIVYYFPNRDAMILGAMLHVTECAQSATVALIEKAVTPHEQLLAIVDGAFSWAKEHPSQVSVLSLFYHGTSYNSSFLSLNKEIRNLGRNRIIAVIKNLHPKLPSEIAEEVAYEIQFHIIGSILWFRSEEKRRRLTDRHAFVRSMSLAALEDPAAWLSSICNSADGVEE